MTLKVALIACVCGGVGAPLCWAIDRLITARTGDTAPWGSLCVNIVGSFALGMVTSLASAMILAPGLRAALGTGLLGGFTTFSTASMQVAGLFRAKRYGLAASTAFEMLGDALLAA